MKLEEIVSNSSGISLITHSKAVKKIGMMLSKKLSLNEDLEKQISIACLLHDLGKCNLDFQNYIKSKSKTISFINSPIFHHEISWAFVSCILNNDEYRYSLDSIYWHHSKPKINYISNDNISLILSDMCDDDKKNILSMYNFLMNENILFEDINFEKSINTPLYYLNEPNSLTNSKNSLVRSCVITADRLVSASDQEKILYDDDYCEELINNLSYKDTKVYSKPINYDSIRFDSQVDYANQSLNNRTTIMKAPAGFGKTLLGLLWSLKSNKKLIWVCPRNIIAENVYNSVLQELKNISVELSVELYLTGNRQKTNNENTKEFTSDIIITNIDNYLSPNVNNSIRNRLFVINYCDVIFDEYHELIKDDALFACFINIMKSRHMLTNSHTLLLSATQTIMEYLWDGTNIDKKTKILPNKNSHYTSAHNGKYLINYIDDIDTITNEKDSVVIMNSISNSQRLYCYKKGDILIHSRYIDSDKEKIMNKIIHLYGKENKNILNKDSIISAPILQASMDISFLNLTDSVMSPETTLQRIGRCDRWGHFYYKKNKTPKINLFFNENKSEFRNSENTSISNQYDLELNKLWISFIKKHIINGNLYSINELYEYYNMFNNENNENLKKFITSKLKTSLLNLCKIEPYKMMEKSKNNTIKNNNTKLRSGGDIYCIYKYAKKRQMTDSFSVDFNRDIKKSEPITGLDSKIKRIIKNIIKIKDDRFFYNKYSLFKNNQYTLPILKDYARKKETPYIAFDKVYCEKLGLVKNDIYDNLI